jgi:hypothetical protein
MPSKTKKQYVFYMHGLDTVFFTLNCIKVCVCVCNVVLFHKLKFNSLHLAIGMVNKFLML